MEESKIGIGVVGWGCIGRMMGWAGRAIILGGYLCLFAGARYQKEILRWGEEGGWWGRNGSTA